MKKTLLTLMIALLAATGSYAQCVASFIDTIDYSTPYPYDVSYINTSTPAANTVYFWTFTGGTPNQANNVSHGYMPQVSYPGPGTYTVWIDMLDTITNCNDSMFATIVVPGTPLSCSASSSAAQCGLCDGTATVTAMGGSSPFTYAWSNGSSSANPQNLCAGAYTVTVSDAFGITSTCNVTVSGIGGISANVSANNYQPCPGDTAFLTATGFGVGNHTYLWTNGDTTQSISVTSTGVYFCTVTDSNGCSGMDSAMINYLPNLTLSYSTTPVSCPTCCDATATLNVSGGSGSYTYVWSTGASSQSVSGLCPGFYNVDVIDSVTGCIGFTIVGINPYACSGLNASVSASTLSACAGDTVQITASATGGTGAYSYFWGTGETTQTIDVTSSGNYIVTVIDSAGCLGIDSIGINFSPALSIFFNQTDETCASCCDGTATAIVSGGSGAYTYNWNSGGTSVTETGLCPGTAVLTVTDTLSGCSYSASVVINAYTPPCYAISGNIDEGGMMGAQVYLIEENNNFLNAVDSTITDSLGNYYFGGVCAGTYFVKAALLPSNPNYQIFLPTYFGDFALWSQSIALVITTGAMNNIDINMIPGANPGGPGFVGGNISQGANSSNGNATRGDRTAVVNAQFILTNTNDELVAFTSSDASGNYSIDNLAYADYKLYVDMINKTSYPLAFTLSEDNVSEENADFIVNATEIRPVLPSGVGTIMDKQMVVYPNPSNGDLTIQGNYMIDQLAIYSVDGRLLMKEQINATQASLELSAWNSGTYIIQIKSNDIIEHHVWVKE